jgi:hypothetical protein
LLLSLVVAVAAKDVWCVILEGGQAQESIQELAHVRFRLEKGAEMVFKNNAYKQYLQKSEGFYLQF